MPDERPVHRRPDGGPARLPDVLQFMQALWAVVHGLEKRSKRMAADLGVTGPQRLVLRAVGLFPGASAGDLSAMLHLHPSTLTGVLKRLTDQGLLERAVDPLDQRRAVLRLTRPGTRTNAATRGTVESAVAAVLRRISPAERQCTQRVLAALARHLGADARGVPRSTRSLKVSKARRAAALTRRFTK